MATKTELLKQLDADADAVEVESYRKVSTARMVLEDLEAKIAKGREAGKEGVA